MRRVLIVAGAIACLIAVSGALVYLLVDVNQFRPAIQAELQKELHRPVTLGPMSLGFFPLAIRVDDVVVGENPAYPTGRPFVTAKQIRVRAELFPLLRKEVRVESLLLVQPTIELVKSLAGQWNFSDLTSQSASARSQPVSFALLQVEEGSFATSEPGKARTVYDHLNIELKDFSPGKTYHLKASAQLPGGKSDAFQFEGSGPSGATNAPFQGRLVLTDAPLAGLAQFTGSTLSLEGQLTGTAELQTGSAGSKGTLQIELKNAVAQGRAIGFPIRLSGSLQGDSRSEVSRFTGSIQAGKVPISVSGETDGKASTVQAAAQVKDASLAEVLGIARLLGAGDLSGTGVVSLEIHAAGPISGELAYSGSGSLRQAELQAPGMSKAIKMQSAALKLAQPAGGPAGSTVTFDLDADKIDVEELRQPASPSGALPSKASGKAAATTRPFFASGTLHVGTLTSDGLVLSNVRASCEFAQGVLTLSPLSAQLFGGTQTGSLRADIGHQPTTVDLNMKLLGVDANQLLSAVSTVRNTLYGSLSAAGELHMATGTANPTRSLNGKLNVSLVRGRLAGTSILSELSSIGKFAGLNLNARNGTNISRMGGDVGIVNGLATTSNLEMVMDGGSMSAAGTANLVDQALNLKVTAVLDKTTSRQTGATGIGGYLTAALSNSNGELVIPANVTGTFANPRFSPDAARLAELKLKKVLPSVGGPGGLQGIVGALSGEKSPGKTTPANNNPAQGIIDIFRKK
ncbi:MAG: AsmA-like C-terminal region-containing protein [Acidobacteriota bacterium]